MNTQAAGQEAIEIRDLVAGFPATRTVIRTTHPSVQRICLDEVEQRLPIPDDVLIAGVDTLPSGTAWWVPQHRVVLVLRDLPAAQRNIALAHETAHIILGHSDIVAEQEVAANTLAAVLLLGAAPRGGRRRAIRSLLAARNVAVPA